MQRIRKYLLKYQPCKLLFSTIPSIVRTEKRWAMFQILLSFVFFFIAAAIGILTVDTSTVSGVIMIVAFFLFGIGLMMLIYAFGIGLYWFRPRYPTNKDEEVKRAKKDDRLHDDIQALIREMRYDRNERKNNPKK